MKKSDGRCNHGPPQLNVLSYLAGGNLLSYRRPTRARLPPKEVEAAVKNLGQDSAATGQIENETKINTSLSQEAVEETKEADEKSLRESITREDAAQEKAAEEHFKDQLVKIEARKAQMELQLAESRARTMRMEADLAEAKAAGVEVSGLQESENIHVSYWQPVPPSLFTFLDDLQLEHYNFLNRNQKMLAVTTTMAIAKQEPLRGSGGLAFLGVTMVTNRIPGTIMTDLFQDITFTEEQDAIIMSMRLANAPWDAICVALDKDLKSVRLRYGELRIQILEAALAAKFSASNATANKSAAGTASASTSPPAPTVQDIDESAQAPVKETVRAPSQHTRADDQPYTRTYVPHIEDQPPAFKLEPDGNWTAEDCQLLEMLEKRYRDHKWLHMQAGFYNHTGRMVQADVIKWKFGIDK